MSQVPPAFILVSSFMEQRHSLILTLVSSYNDGVELLPQTASGSVTEKV